MPAGVAAALDFVAPTVHIPGVRKSHGDLVEESEARANSDNVPSTLRELYSVGDAVGKAPCAPSSTPAR